MVRPTIQSTLVTWVNPCYALGIFWLSKTPSADIEVSVHPHEETLTGHPVKGQLGPVISGFHLLSQKIPNA